MVSRSSSRQASSTSNRDNRIIAEGEGIGVNSEGGDVLITQIPDEAFELAEAALINGQMTTEQVVSEFADITARAQDQSRSESTQLAEQVIRIGIPVAGLVFLLSRIRS